MMTWRRPAARLGLACGLILALAGCYMSDADLIGTHAARMTRFDALLPIHGEIYFARNVGAVTELCSARTRRDLAIACAAPTRLQVEPLGGGDYLLQVDSEMIGGHGYGVLVRDGQDPRAHCVMWLGAGVVDTVDATNPALAFVRDASFARLRRALAAFPRQTLRNRDELLRIAAVYRRFARGASDPPACFGERVRFDPDLITVAR